MPKLVAYLVALVLACDLAVVGVNYLADETSLITDGSREPVTTQPPGLATPRDAADFTADARTTLTATGGVVVKLPPQTVELRGPGRVSTAGRLQVRTATSTRQARTVEFGPGPFTATLDRTGGALDVDAVLQGPVRAS